MGLPSPLREDRGVGQYPSSFLKLNLNSGGGSDSASRTFVVKQVKVDRVPAENDCLRKLCRLLQELVHWDGLSTLIAVQQHQRREHGRNCDHKQFLVRMHNLKAMILYNVNDDVRHIRT